MFDKLLQDHRTGQDSTQLESFVLGGRTQWGTYKQALREMYKRIRGLRQMITDRDLLLIDIEESEELIESSSGRDLRRAKIDHRSMLGRLEESERGIVDTKREAAIFYRVAASLKEELGDIDEARRIELDRAEWKWWHTKRAAISKIASGRVDDVVLKNLMSLPISERHDWLDVIKDDNKLVGTLENAECGRIPLPAPTVDDIKLIESEVDNG